MEFPWGTPATYRHAPHLVDLGTVIIYSIDHAVGRHVLGWWHERPLLRIIALEIRHWLTPPMAYLRLELLE